MKISRILLLVALFWGIVQCVSAQDNSSVCGFVFDDANRNGIMDNDEKGVPDVSVSNQIQVVQTDKDGRYSLPLRDKMIVFFSKPSGYDVPLSDKGIPQFFYIYQPQGSPQTLRYPGVKPTGDLPSGIDFPLYKSEYREKFSAVISGDPQMGNDVEVSYFRKAVVPMIKKTDAAFYMPLGDIAFNNLSIYPGYLDAVSSLHMPLYHVLGNHDENLDAPDNESANETFHRFFGPAYYSFNYGKVHFIVLDTVEYQGWDKEINKERYRGYVVGTELAWMENDLKFVPEGNLIVLAMHISLYARLTKAEANNVVNRQEVFKLLEKRKNLLALSGHLHIIEHFPFSSESGWTSPNQFYSINAGAACGGWWSGPQNKNGIPVSNCMDGSPNGFYLFSFDGNKYDYKFIPVQYGENFQMRISSPAKSLTKDAVASTQIIANIFCADPGAKVHCQVDDGKQQVMERKTMKDPFMTDYVIKYRSALPNWVKSEADTEHIWAAPLPQGLNEGSHLIKVNAIDSLGKTYSGERRFQITKSK